MKTGLKITRRLKIDLQAIFADAGVSGGRLMWDQQFGFVLVNEGRVHPISAPTLQPGETRIDINGSEWVFRGPKL